MRFSTLAIFSALLAAATGVQPASAQVGSPGLSADDDSTTGRPASSAREVPSLRAHPLETASIDVDGRLDEAAWRAADVATDFVGFTPEEGAEPSQETEARVLYGTDAVYVGIRAFDTAPDSIASQLTRRDDGGSYSDWVRVLIDSYHDQRTAFQFAVNPRGVKTDIYHYDDVREDDSWDAVWDVATSVDAEGWTAEFRIPFSQLRFSEDGRTWGINFARDIARTGETVVWAPLSRNESRVVSRSGKLEGLRDLPSARRLEVLPYAVGRLDRENGVAANPYWEENDFAPTVGLDVKYGLTSDLTLDLTVNPDFGQVEADPAQVNLSAFETFLPEQRPFFIEGQSIFDFSLELGDGGAQSLFYSRRIGRRPQGGVSAGPGGFAEVEDQTTILGAGKLSGKTAGGWSIGLLYAATQEEEARVTPEGSAPFTRVVEPFTNYGVARIQRDFREGRSAVGIIGTAVMRDGEAADDLLLHTEAFTGGADFRHRFGAEDEYQVRGYLLGSLVQGSEDAIARTQLSSARYYQRPDADHVEFDPTRESLAGWAGQFGLHRIGGENWRWGTDVQLRSPGFEANDIGFMRESDYVIHGGFLSYHVNQPSEHFRRWNLNLNAFHGYTFGGERTATNLNVNGSFQLTNFWHGFAGVNRDFGALSSSMLRGGPLFQREGAWNGWAGFGTDGRNPVFFGQSLNWSVRPESDSWSLNLSPHVRWRPSARASLSLGAFWNRNVDDRQWVSRILHEDGDADYVLGRLDQTTMGLTGRLDFSFTPDLSLQLYAQPFVSSGSYGELKVVTDPRAGDYDGRLRRLEVTAVGESAWESDVDGDGDLETIPVRDFDFRQFRSNAVLRWEYRPGSTLFLVWSQGRDRFAGGRSAGDFAFGDDFGDLFSTSPEDFFMVKLSYWLAP